MARTQAEIVEAILTQKAATAELDALSSPSQTAVWRLWVNVVAFCHRTLEELWDWFRADVQAIADRASPGTVGWIAAQSKRFQYSESEQYLLTVAEDGVVGYSQVVPEAQIIAYASVRERSDGLVQIKVAKADGAGDPSPLTSPELTAFEGYYSKIKFPGVRTIITSQVAARVRVQGTVYYAPGSELGQVQAAVEAAIASYLRAIPFDGLLYREKLQDAVQAIPTVISFPINSLTVDGAEVPRVEELLPGYGVLDPDAALSGTLTYTPENA